MKRPSNLAIFSSIAIAAALTVVCVSFHTTASRQTSGTDTGSDKLIPDSDSKSPLLSPFHSDEAASASDQITIDRTTKHRIRVEKAAPSVADSLSPVSPSATRKKWRVPSQQTITLPASFVLADDPSDLPPGADEFLNELAKDFKAKMEDSGHTPEDPAYKKLWEQESFLNDIRFQTMFGDLLWMRQQAQAAKLLGQ